MGGAARLESLRAGAAGSHPRAPRADHAHPRRDLATIRASTRLKEFHQPRIHPLRLLMLNPMGGLRKEFEPAVVAEVDAGLRQLLARKRSLAPQRRRVGTRTRGEA